MGRRRLPLQAQLRQRSRQLDVVDALGLVGVPVDVVRRRITLAQERLECDQSIDDAHSCGPLRGLETQRNSLRGILAVCESNLDAVARSLTLNDSLNVPIVRDQLSLDVVKVEHVRTCLDNLQNHLFLGSFSLLFFLLGPLQV